MLIYKHSKIRLELSQVAPALTRRSRAQLTPTKPSAKTPSTFCSSNSIRTEAAPPIRRLRMLCTRWNWMMMDQKLLAPRLWDLISSGTLELSLQPDHTARCCGSIEGNVEHILTHWHIKIISRAKRMINHSPQFIFYFYFVQQSEPPTYIKGCQKISLLY